MSQPVPHPKLADLRAFVAVGRLLAFAAAAKELHLSESALSRRIASLEQELGLRLLDRNTRSVSLTAPGERFLAHVQSAIAELDRAVQDLYKVARLEAGEVSVGCMFSAVHDFLPAVIQTFQTKHPLVFVRIVEAGADEVLQSVHSGQVDFAINYIGRTESDVVFTPLAHERFVLACATGHPLSRLHQVPWGVLRQYPYAQVAQASRNRALIDQALAERVGQLPPPVCEVQHIATLIGLVESGAAVAIVPQLTLPRDTHKVVGIPLEGPPVVRTIGLIRRADKSLTPAAQAFMQLLIDTGLRAD